MFPSLLKPALAKSRLATSGFRKMGRDFSLPCLPRHKLESGYGCAVVGLIGFSTVALAAELRRLVRVRGGASRVVRSADEEHGAVVARGQAGVRALGYFDHIHHVLVVAAGAGHNRSVVIGGELDEEAVVRYKLRRIRAVHNDRAVGLGA